VTASTLWRSTWVSQFRFRVARLRCRSMLNAMKDYDQAKSQLLKTVSGRLYLQFERNCV